MKVFFSHCSRDKPLIREIRNLLQSIDGVEGVSYWIDERELIIGDDIEMSIERAIKNESDLLVVFLPDGFFSSKWLMKELRWALEREGRIGRKFVLPVLLDASVAEWLDIVGLGNRLYLQLHDFSERQVKSLAEDLKGHLYKELSGLAQKARACDLVEHLIDDIAELGARISVHKERYEGLEDLFKGEKAMAERSTSDIELPIWHGLERELSALKEELSHDQEQLEEKKRQLEYWRSIVRVFPPPEEGGEAE